MTTLLDLPSEILDEILRFQSVSHRSVDLWKCGNRRLQWVLARAISSVELRDAKSFTYSTFPEMLCHFRSLRSLKINRFSKRLGDPVKIAKLVQQLSSTLHTLEICSSESHHIFMVEPEIPTSFFDEDPVVLSPPQDLPPLSNLWDISSFFPSLRALKIRGGQRLTLPDLAALPSTLTSLICDVYVDKWIFSGLPRGLEHLELLPIGTMAEIDPTVEDMRQLPPNLTFLKTNGSRSYSSEVLEVLPRSLRRIPEFHPCWTVAVAKAIPPLIERVTIQTIDQLHAVDLLTTLPQSLVSLNIALQELFPIGAKMLQALPPTLNRLSLARIVWDDLTRRDWPPALRDLEVRGPSNGALDASKFAQLPLKLTKFDYSSEPMSFKLIEHLEMPNIEYLNLIVHEPSSDDYPVIFSLPDTLTMLFLYGTSGDRIVTPAEGETPQLLLLPISSLPRHLVSLILDTSTSHLHTSQFKRLPPTMTELQVHKLLAEWKDIVPTLSPEEVSLHELDFISSWPRSLISVTINEPPFIQDPTAFRALPPKLQTLYFATDKPLSHRIISFLPPSIADISLHIDQITDKIVAQLPKSLKYISLDSPDESSLTLASLDSISPNAHSWGIGFGIKIDLSKHFLARRRQLEAEMPPHKRSTPPLFHGLPF